MHTYPCNTHTTHPPRRHSNNNHSSPGCSFPGVLFFGVLSSWCSSPFAVHRPCGPQLLPVFSTPAWGSRQALSRWEQLEVGVCQAKALGLSPHCREEPGIDCQPCWSRTTEGNPGSPVHPRMQSIKEMGSRLLSELREEKPFPALLRRFQALPWQPPVGHCCVRGGGSLCLCPPPSLHPQVEVQGRCSVIGVLSPAPSPAKKVACCSDLAVGGSWEPWRRGTSAPAKDFLQCICVSACGCWGPGHSLSDLLPACVPYSPGAWVPDAECWCAVGVRCPRGHSGSVSSWESLQGWGICVPVSLGSDAPFCCFSPPDSP